MTVRSATPSVFSLLPEIYRHTDAATGDSQLFALCDLIDNSRAMIEQQTRALYDGWFVETCELDQLEGIAKIAGGPSGDPSPGVPTGVDPRAMVAGQAEFARRKGTALATSRYVRPLSGWSARTWLDEDSTVNVTVHQVRLQTLRGSSPRVMKGVRAGGTRMHFHPLGFDVPLFRASSADALQQDPKIKRDDDADVLARNIKVWTRKGEDDGWQQLSVRGADLSQWVPGKAQAHEAIVDPQLGRLWLPGTHWSQDTVMIECTFAKWLPDTGIEQTPARISRKEWRAHIHRFAPTGERGGVHYFRSFADALEQSRDQCCDLHFHFLDSATHAFEEIEFSDATECCPPDPNVPRTITLSAREGEWPTLRGRITARSSERPVTFAMERIMLDGQLTTQGEVMLELDQCLVMPVSLMRAIQKRLHAILAILSPRDNPAQIRARASVTGPIHSESRLHLRVTDCVVDDPWRQRAGQGPHHIEAVGSTFLGSVRCTSMTAKQCAFFGEVLATDHRELEHCHKDKRAGGERKVLLGDQIDEPGYATPDRSVHRSPLVKRENFLEIGASRMSGALIREDSVRTAFGQAKRAGGASLLYSGKSDASGPSQLLPPGLGVTLTFEQEQPPSKRR